jgi:cell division septation protein DedD
MTSGGKRSAGERVLESKHVIGLFLLMLLFSGVFFTLGYVMGRNQYDSQVRAATSFAGRAEPGVMPKADTAVKKPADTPPTATEAESDPATTAASSDWEELRSNKAPKSEPHLEPAPKPAAVPPSAAKSLNARGKAQPQPVSVPVKSAKPVAAPLVPSGAYLLQVAALLRQDDALAVATSLQKKHYPCYVQAPQKDKYYRVQVGPYKDRKVADTAKQGLENEGFKAFYVKH